MDYQGEERRTGHMCNKEAEFAIIHYQCTKVEEFIETATPMLEYLRSQMEKNQRVSEMYQKVTEHVLGAAALAGVSAVGYWLLSNIKDPASWK